MTHPEQETTWLLLAPAAEPAAVAEGPSDHQLAVRVAGGGDPAAEAELVLRFTPRVRLYGLRHLREPAAADDLVQEVLLLTLERLRAGRVREPERLALFVFGACRLVIRNQRLGTRRRDVLLERFAAEFPAGRGRGRLPEARPRAPARVPLAPLRA